MLNKNLKLQFWNVFKPGQPDLFSSGRICNEDFIIISPFHQGEMPVYPERGFNLKT